MANINQHIYVTVFVICCGYKRGYTETVRWLLTKNINIHAKNDLAFKSACRNGHLEIMNLLCERCPNYNYMINTTPSKYPRMYQHIINENPSLKRNCEIFDEQTDDEEEMDEFHQEHLNKRLKGEYLD
jgi:hypothetical protein